MNKAARKKSSSDDHRPDAWNRFLMAVGFAVKTPPMHRQVKKTRPASKGRVRKGKSRA
jgi:hypothetical protein